MLSFLIAPLLPACLAPWVDPDFHVSDPWQRVHAVVLYAVVGAYPATLALGLPAFLILRARVAPTPLNCALCGAIVAAFPWLVLGLFFEPNGAYDHGRVTVENGSLTPAGWIELLQHVGTIALWGALGGAIFWAIAAAGTKSTPHNDEEPQAVAYYSSAGF